MTRTFAPTPSPAAPAPGPARPRGLPRSVAVLQHPRRHAGTAARQDRDPVGDDHGHPADDPADRPTAPRTLAYADRMTIGPLPASGGAHFPVRRPAAPGTRP
ncbi:hypothetical protein ACFTXB_10090 [Streptomyces sp. NPDC057074]|uniref:hypothetical protein n=1 Tax=Streptomyces sp. NPDC057074 TaxID=3346015 RepID=UPI003629B385